MTDVQLAEAQLDPHEWIVREFAPGCFRMPGVAAATESLGRPPAIAKLTETILQHNPDENHQLRALWSLHVTGALGKELALGALSSDKQYLVAWKIQLLCEQNAPPEEAVAIFAKLAAKTQSAVVRLYLASALQRMPEEQRWDILPGLLSRAEDAGDHNLPLMDWWALEPLCAKDSQRALALASEAKIPRLLSFAVRRIGASGGNATDALVAALGKLDDSPRQLEVLNGIRDSLQGRRNVEHASRLEGNRTQADAKRRSGGSGAGPGARHHIRKRRS